jgi:hypothetical protein
MPAHHSHSPEKKGHIAKPADSGIKPPQPESVTVNEVQSLLNWSAFSRPYRKKQRIYYLNLILIMLTVEIILFLFGQHLLMLVVASLVFLAFAFASTPPVNVQYRISSEGIAIEDHFYLWQELYDFYFKQIDGLDILHVRTKTYILGELIITLGDIPKDKIRSILLPFLPYREITHTTFTERAGDWITKTFPLENRPS